MLYLYLHNNINKKQSTANQELQSLSPFKGVKLKEHGCRGTEWGTQGFP